MRILATADIHLGAPIRSIALRNQELGSRLVQASRDVFADIVDLAIAALNPQQSILSVGYKQRQQIPLQMPYV